MPSRLSRKVTRVVPSRWGRDLVITLASEGLYVRELGRRTEYGPIAYGALLVQGARQYVAEQKKLKAEHAKTRRLARSARGG